MSLARATAHNFVTIALNAAAGLLLTAVIARWLGPADMGAYSLLTWLLAMAGILVNLGSVTTTMKYVAEALGRGEAGHAEAGAVLADGVRLIGRNALLVSIAWLIAGPWVPAALPIAVLAIAPVALMALFVAACQGLQRYDCVAVGTAIWAGSLAAGTLAALAAGQGLAGLVAAQALAATLACAYHAHGLARWQPGWWRLRPSAERRAALRGYGGVLMVLILLDAVVWQRSGVFFLGLWAPPAEAAYYALAFALAQTAMRMIPGTLVGLLIPSMSRSFGAGDMAHVASIYRAAGRWMAVLAVPVAVGGTLLAPALVELLYGPAFAPTAAPLALLLLTGAGVMVFGFPASSVLYAVERHRAMAWIGLAAAAVMVGLSCWLVPSAGALGAAIATAAAQLFVLAPGAICAGRALGGVAPDVRRLPRVLAAAALMAVPVGMLAQALPPLPALLLAAPAGALVYAIGLWLFDALPPEDRARVEARLRPRFVTLVTSDP